LDHQDPKERKESLDFKDHLEPEECLDLKVRKEILVLQDFLATQENKVQEV
jgi:hypothetical protein